MLPFQPRSIRLTLSLLAVVSVAWLSLPAAGLAAPRPVIGLWPEAVDDEKLAGLRKAAAADDAGADKLDALAVAYGSRGMWGECVDTAKQAIERDTKLSAARTTLAGCYLSLGRDREGLRAAREATELDTQSWYAFYMLGWAQRQIGDSRKAIAALRRSVELDPEQAWAQYSLAVACSRAQNFRCGRTALAATMKLDPDERLERLASELDGQISAVEGALLGSYATSVEKHPEVPSAHVLLAQVSLQLGYENAALESADRAIALLPKERDTLDPKQRGVLARAQRIRGGAFLGLGQLAEAKAALEDAIELEQDAGAAYYDLGLVLLALEEPAAAATQLERAVELAPLQKAPRFALIEAYEAAGKDELAAKQLAHLETM